MLHLRIGERSWGWADGYFAATHIVDGAEVPLERRDLTLRVLFPIGILVTLSLTGGIVRYSINREASRTNPDRGWVAQDNSRRMT